MLVCHRRLETFTTLHVHARSRSDKVRGWRRGTLCVGKASTHVEGDDRLHHNAASQREGVFVATRTLRSRPKHESKPRIRGPCEDHTRCRLSDWAAALRLGRGI